MKRFFKILAWALLALVCIAAIAYLVIMAINRNDRPQAAAAKKLLDVFSQVPQVRDEDNGFVYVLGFGAAKGQDPLTVGAQRVAWTHQAAKSAGDLPNAFPGAGQYRHAQHTDQMLALMKICKSADRACHAALEAGGAVIDDLIAVDALLLERYRVLLSRPAWRETAALDLRLPPPSYGIVMDGQRLLFLQAWRDAGRGDAGAVRQLLGADTAFWRMALASADTILSKAIATAALKRNFAWGNLILRRLPWGAIADAVPAQWRAEISATERSLLRGMAGEFIAVANATKFFRAERSNLSGTAPQDMNAADLATVILMPTFQEQDYKNRYAALATAVADTLDVPYKAYPAALLKARELEQDTAAEAFGNALYNWPGNMLIAGGTAEFTSYAVRVADIEGLRRLALLAAELRGANIPPDQARARLAKSALRDPYDGRPFNWDADTASIVFVGLEPAPRGRHVLPI